MTSAERVLAALRCEEPDRVPYCELGIDRALADKLMGWGGSEDQALSAHMGAKLYTLEEATALAELLHLDNLCYVLRAPIFADQGQGQDGRIFYGEGHIRSQADLGLLQLPPPDEADYEDAEAFASQKGNHSAWLVSRIGIFPTMLSLGLETFSVALHEDLGFVETVLDRYCDWTAALAERACGLGFDVFVSTDDMAFKTAPFFSPKVFRDLVLPRYERVAEAISLPWVLHSDGNMLPFLDDLLSVGIAAFHPIEKGAMDIRSVKESYGGRICLMGNVDLNILGLEEPEDVEKEVRGLIQDVGPGGGYIVASGNSLAGYLRPDNVVALAEAVQRYGRYPLSASG